MPDGYMKWSDDVMRGMRAEANRKYAEANRVALMCDAPDDGHRWPVALELVSVEADGSRVWKCPSCFTRYRTEAPDA